MLLDFLSFFLLLLTFVILILFLLIFLLHLFTLFQTLLMFLLLFLLFFSFLLCSLVFGIENINKEISLLQDRFQVNKNSLNQFKNWLRRIRRLRLKQGQKTNLSETKNTQEALRIYLKIRLSITKKSLIY